VSETATSRWAGSPVDARLAASDVAAFQVAYVRQNGQFRQINQDPSYRGTNVLQMAGNLRVDRFLPTSLGLAMPLTVSYTRTAVNPELLTGTDIRGEALTGLRKPDSRSATVSLAIRRSQPGKSWATKGFVDPLTVAASLTTGRALTELSEHHAARELNDDIIARRRRLLGDEHPETMMAGAFDLILRGLDLGGEPEWMTALREASKRRQQEARELSEDEPG